MRAGALAAAAGAVAVLAASPALAAEGHGGSAVDQLVYPAINLVVLLAVLVFFGRKPIAAFFRDRRARIQEELSAAAELQSRAEARNAELQRKLADLQGELDQIRATAGRRAEAERESILADAAAAAERIQRDARAAIDQELRRAREELREEASDLAVELAGRLLSERLTDADRDRMVTEFIESVERAPALEDRR